MNCLERQGGCPCPEFSKAGLCDWPYRNGMSFQEARYMTENLQVIEQGGTHEQRKIESQRQKRRA